MNTTKNANKFMFYILCYLIFLSNFFGLIFSKIFPMLFTFSYFAFNLMLSSCLCFLLPTCFYTFKTKIPLKELLLLKKLSLKNIILISLIAFLSQPLMSLISSLTSLFFKNDVNETILNYINLPFWQMFLAIGIFPAINEEIVFRGIIFNGYKNQPATKACIITGLFFGIMHLNKHQFFYAMVIGILFAYLVKITGSIWASILAHFLINGSQILKVYLLKAIYPDLFFKTNLEQINTLNFSTIFVCFVQFLISLPFLVFFIRLLIKNNPTLKKDTKNNEKIFTIHFYLTVILFLVYVYFF